MRKGQASVGRARPRLPRVRPNRKNGTCGWCHEDIYGPYKVVRRTRAPFKDIRVHPDCKSGYVDSMEGKSS